MSLLDNRAVYTGVGFLRHYLDEVLRPKPRDSELRDLAPIQNHYDESKTYVLFIFGYAPPYEKAERLFLELKSRFVVSGDIALIGASCSVRTMADVKGAEEDYRFDGKSLEGFLEAAEETNMPVFIISSGIQWSEVVYNKSPLIKMLESDLDNCMLFNDGKRVPRRLQPPADIPVIGKIIGKSGLGDRNGVVYLSMHSPQVLKYQERNLREMADIVADFNKKNPDLLIGVSVENEVDFPGTWIRKDRFADYGFYAVRAFRNYVEKRFDGNWKRFCEEFPGPSSKCTDFRALEPPRVYKEGDEFWEDLWQSFRVDSVINRVKASVDILRSAGIPSNKIYTHQSVEDAYKRASPLETADIDGSQIGVACWRTGNSELFARVNELAKSKQKKWALLTFNPLSDYQGCCQELEFALANNVHIINAYNWWPHFLGYGVRGMPFEKALKDFFGL